MLEKSRFMVDIVPIYNEKSSSNLINNIYHSTPIGYYWLFNGKKYSIINEDRVIMLSFDNKLAVIESPFKKSNNKAYLINLDNEILFDISDVFYLEYRTMLLNKTYIFTDILVVDDKLFFYVNINNTDFRFLVDIRNKKIGKLIESK
ncbi:hypothetical protein CAPN006_18800 [Capnocytophaga canimorsus]|uniref:hypothetical protein n=1 Tax=Capnocytophaga canimorsus TaxID=28188 RepID=UPI001AC44A20|nr:hypothetical protein [Capnocytophaga canimorsus]GIM57488.1 hypothetical protein CAPN006_18800 [Capnocytophaga canimorsus]